MYISRALWCACKAKYFFAMIIIIAPSTAVAAIDRRDVVQRHSVRMTSIDTTAPLTVGNGQFAFTADVTGLQTLNATYLSPPLQTMSHWAWHVVPAKLAGVTPSAFIEQMVTVNGHVSHYPTSCDKQQPLCNYLRSNPHRFNLGRLFLQRLVSARPAAPIDDGSLTNINQTLDLWSGTLRSSFSLDGTPVAIETVVHPKADQLAVRVCSPLVERAQLGIGVGFPYPDTSFKGGSDWSLPSRHLSERLDAPSTCDSQPLLKHTLDGTTVFVHMRLGAHGGSDCVRLVDTANISHSWSIVPVRVPLRDATVASDPACLEASLLFTLERAHSSPPTTVDVALAASAMHWSEVWRSGAAIDLSNSKVVGARELERRVVLSQYILISQEAGTNPPQETGLVLNSWYGKFHLEMRWQYAVLPHHCAFIFARLAIVPPV